MTRDDLIEILAEAQVDPTYYSIGGEAHEALCLTNESDVWHVFLSERGTRHEERTFTIEDNACTYFLKRIFQLWRPR
jgi:hypothetical protein